MVHEPWQLSTVGTIGRYVCIANEQESRNHLRYLGLRIWPWGGSFDKSYCALYLSVYLNCSAADSNNNTDEMDRRDAEGSNSFLLLLNNNNNITSNTILICMRNSLIFIL